MTLLERSLCGSRIPTLLRLPPGDLDYRLADDLLSWVDTLGLTLFDWQRDVLRRGWARAGGRHAAYESTLICPRQNGKNEVLVAMELAAVTFGCREVVHSAHEAITAQKHFARFQELADRLPEVAKLLPDTATRGFFTSNGKEHISFRNGAVIDFRTRTRKAGRGFSADLVVLDEAFDLSPKAVGALMYTLRARRNPQIWKTSSAAHSGSVVLHADRKRADDDDPIDSRFLFHEWGNEPGVEPDDPEAWARSNPSLGLEAPGFRLEVQTFRNEHAAARHDPDLLAEFVREVCGVAETPAGIMVDSPIDLSVWADLTDGESKPTSQIRLALDVTEPHEPVFGIAGVRSDALPHVSVRWRIPLHGPGSLRQRVVAKALELCTEYDTALILPPGSPARAWRGELVKAGVVLDELTSTEFAEGCLALRSVVVDGVLRHRGQVDMNAAVAGLATKPVGDVDVWSRRNSSVNISPIVAATCALMRVPSTEPETPTSVAIVLGG